MVIFFNVYMQPGISTNGDRQVMTMSNLVETSQITPERLPCQILYCTDPFNFQHDRKSRLRAVLGIVHFLRATTTPSRGLRSSDDILHLGGRATQLRFWRGLDMLGLSFRARLG